MIKQYPHLDNSNPRLCIARKILKCSRIITKIFRKYIQPFGVTYSQVSMLFLVAKKGKISQQQIADDLVLEKSTVSRNLQRLLDNEFLIKESRFEITISNKGKSLLEEIVPEWDKAMAETRDAIGAEGEDALNLLLTNLA